MNAFRTRRTTAAVAGLGISLALVLVGCSTPTDTDDGGEADTSGVQHAQEQLDTYTKVVDGFVPSEPIEGIGDLAGKTVVYIPAVASIPFFSTSFTGLKGAFDVVGIDVQICDGQANPATTSACLDQALNTGAAGVIMDALPPALAQESFDAVVAAGIPVVLGNIPVPEGSPDTVQQVGPDTALATSLAADAIIAQSEGAASVLTVTVIDSPVTEGWMTNGALAEFEEFCPDCKVSNVDTKTADLQALPAKVSAAVLADPSIDYLLPELSPEVVPTIQGATDAGKTGLPAASTATTLGDLQSIAADGLFASVGWDVVRTGWLEADALMRLIVGQEFDASQYVSPVRVFTTDNVGDLDLSQEGWDSSNWFGGDDYQDALTELWTK